MVSIRQHLTPAPLLTGEGFPRFQYLSSTHAEFRRRFRADASIIRGWRSAARRESDPHPLSQDAARRD
jgi:hypothetical protein